MRLSLFRLIRSFGFAFAGVAHIVASQPNFQIHLLVAALVIILALVLEIPPPEMAVLALTIGLVVATEAANTAIESAVDAIGGPPSLAAKRAKDSAAGAVLLAAVAAVVTGLLIFGPRLLSRLGH